MKLRILVLYYTQSGQMRHVLDNLLSQVHGVAEIDFTAIEPVEPFPFPWTMNKFFDAMPETVLGPPAPVKPLPASVRSAHYDLIILGYQPWFLHPSQPVAAFLQGDDVQMLDKRPVVTVVASCNMWLNAQERVKESLAAAGARLVGNIALTDNHADPIPLLTMMRWMIKGQKQASTLLPAAGVPDEELAQVFRLGMHIEQHLADDNLIDLQRALLASDGVKFSMWMLMQERIRLKCLTRWASKIKNAGAPGSPLRLKQVAAFRRYLLAAVVIVGPFNSALAMLRVIVAGVVPQKDREYFTRLKFEKDRL